MEILIWEEHSMTFRRKGVKAEVEKAPAGSDPLTSCYPTPLQGMRATMSAYTPWLLHLYVGLLILPYCVAP